MKTFKSTLLIFLLVFGIISCDDDLITTDYDLANIMVNPELLTMPQKAKMKKATGSVEIIWKGGKKGSDMGNQPENLRAFFDFNANEDNKNTGKGEVVFRVTAQDLTIHREIRANVLDVNFDIENRSWFVARVISDSKGCNGGPGGEGHESGCSGEDDGGCGDDTEHDGGCTDEHTTDEGGCADTHTDEESCSGSDAGAEGGKPEVTGSEGKGNPLSGKNCRIGQLIIVKVHDKATPGAAGDGLTWKWFAPEYDYNISLEPTSLCKKTIIGGNLVVHL